MGKAFVQTVLPIAGMVVGNMLMPGIGGMALGGALGGAVGGHSYGGGTSGMLRGAALGGAGGAGAGYLGGLGSGGSRPCSRPWNNEYFRDRRKCRSARYFPRRGRWSTC